MKRRLGQRRFWYMLVVLCVLVVLSFWLSHSVLNSPASKAFLAKYGYIGAVLCGAVAGFNIFFPLPAIIFMPLFIAAGLNPIWTAALLALGMTFADTIEYYTAKAGWDTAESAWLKKFKNKLLAWKNRHRILPLGGLLIYTIFAPLPNELLLPFFAAGGYRIRNVLIILFFGNTLFNLLYGLTLTQIFSFI